MRNNFVKHPETGTGYHICVNTSIKPSQIRGLHGGRIIELEIREEKSGRLLYRFHKGKVETACQTPETRDMLYLAIGQYHY